MTLSQKIIALRKSKGLSQEALAEKLGVSRQAVSRWEVGSAMPDASNILQLSKLFSVTTDYLLHDDYESDNDLPKVQEITADHSKQILLYLTILEVMILLLQVMTTFVLQNAFFSMLTFLPFVATMGGFEYAHRKAGVTNERTVLFRKRFYIISAWLGLYFPIRFLFTALSQLFTRPYSWLAFECVVLTVYLAAALIATLSIEQEYLSK